MRTIKLVKFELYPIEVPEGYAVGFSFEANTRAGYIDTLVKFEESINLTNEQIVDAAMLKVKDTIRAKLSEFNSINPLIGIELELPVGNVSDPD